MLFEVRIRKTITTGQKRLTDRSSVAVYYVAASSHDDAVAALSHEIENSKRTGREHSVSAEQFPKRYQLYDYESDGRSRDESVKCPECGTSILVKDILHDIDLDFRPSRAEDSQRNSRKNE